MWRVVGVALLLSSRDGGGRLSGGANGAKHPMADGPGLSCAASGFSCETSGCGWKFDSSLPCYMYSSSVNFLYIFSAREVSS